MNCIATLARESPADQYLELAGARLRFRDEGRGPVVVLIHGWTLDLEMWEPQICALSASFRLIRFDRRGFGLSSGQPSLSCDLTDLQALLTHLQIERAALVGMSQGARVAIQAAALMPACVACIVLDGPPSDELTDAAGADALLPLDEYRQLVRTSGMEAFRRVWASHFYVRLRTADARVRELLKQIIARYPGRDLIGPVIDPPLAPHTPWPARNALAVLLINGAFDSEHRLLASAALRRTLPGAEWLSVPDSGHLPNLDNPQAYNLALSKFLRKYLSPGE